MKDTKKLLVGIFLIVGALVFGIGLFFIGNKKQTFSRHVELYTEYADLSTLPNGAKVRVAGMDAGQILEINVPKDAKAKFRIKLRIEEKFRPLVRKNSIAIIQTEGLVGNKYIDIQRGSEQSAEVNPGDTIGSNEPFDFGDFTQQAGELVKTAKTTMDEIRQNLNAAIQTAGKAVTDADSLIVSLSAPLQQVATTATKITKDVDTIVSGLNEGRGPAGRLLKDEQMATNLSQAMENTNRATANLDKVSAKANDIVTDFESRQLVAKMQATLENTRQITDQLNQAVSGFTSGTDRSGSSAANLRQTIASAQATMTNLADDTEAIKHNFFLRGFFKRRGFYDLENLTPAQYMKTKFVKQNASQRIWVEAAIFAVRPDGSLDVSPDGRARLDQAMSGVVGALPNGAVMVEGYAVQGPEGERYLKSRRRADAVRRYLQSEFHLDPKKVGIMPFAATPPVAAGKTEWDGVSVVVLR